MSEEQKLQSVEETPLATSGEVVPQEPKRLMRSRRERVLFGVCGGIAQYFRIDPVLVRALWVLLSLITGFVPGVILYGIATVVVPENRGEEAAPGRRLPFESNLLWGGLLVIAGLYFLFRSLGRYVLPSLPPGLSDLWNGLWSATRAMTLPAILIGIGLLLIFGIGRKNGDRRLVRSAQDRIIAGVCGGVGAYFNVDPTWVRLAWAILTVASVGIGAILYLVAILAIPEEVLEKS